MLQKCLLGLFATLYVSSTLLSAQEAPPEKVLKFEAIIDEASGEAKIVPQSELDFEEGLKEFQSSDFETRKAADLTTGYAYYNSDGELSEVIAGPLGSLQQEYLFNRIQTGGKVQAVGFWDATPKLPTVDEAREITQSAINSALAVVCGSKPQPEDLSIEVSLATAMRLEGRFALKMDWKPNRDCTETE